MSPTAFIVIALFVAGMGFLTMANRIFTLVALQARDKSPESEAMPIAFYPWTGIDVLARHRKYYPESWLRVVLFAFSFGAAACILGGAFLMPDPRA